MSHTSGGPDGHLDNKPRGSQWSRGPPTVLGTWELVKLHAGVEAPRTQPLTQRCSAASASSGPRLRACGALAAYATCTRGISTAMASCATNAIGPCRSATKKMAPWRNYARPRKEMVMRLSPHRLLECRGVNVRTCARPWWALQEAPRNQDSADGSAACVRSTMAFTDAINVGWKTSMQGAEQRPPLTTLPPGRGVSSLPRRLKSERRHEELQGRPWEGQPSSSAAGKSSSSA